MSVDSVFKRSSRQYYRVFWDPKEAEGITPLNLILLVIRDFTAILFVARVRRMSQLVLRFRELLRRPRVANAVKAYEDFIGLSDVKIAQHKVIDAQVKFETAQEERRRRQLKMNAIHAELRKLHEEIDKTHRTDDRYLTLVTQEHSLIKEEKLLSEEFNYFEKSERDYFSALSMAVRDSQEKERAQAEKSKYWSIIGSICGAVIGIVGTSVNNWMRMRELRRLMTDGPQEHHWKIRSDLSESIEKQERALSKFLKTLEIRSDSCAHQELEKETKKLIVMLGSARGNVLNTISDEPKQEIDQSLRTLTFLSSLTILIGVVTLGYESVCSRVCIMAANLPYEVCKFIKNSSYLRRIIRDTHDAIQDIKSCGYFTVDQLESLGAREVELAEVGRRMSCPLCLVIMGQTPFGKASVVNELFGTPILPLVRDLDSHLAWRTVRFVSGKGPRAQISLALPNSYELVERLQAYERPWKTVPQADLLLRDGDFEDPAKESAVLEVQLRHPLLLSGASVVVSPCNHLDSVESVFKKVTEGVLPVLIYTISDERLSPKELRELEELRLQVGSFPVFFVRVSPPSKTSTWELTESQQHEVMAGGSGQSNHENDRYSSSDEHSSESSVTGPEGAWKESYRAPPSPPESDGAHFSLQAQLTRLGFLSTVKRDDSLPTRWILGRKGLTVRKGSLAVDSSAFVESELIEGLGDFAAFVGFARRVFQSYLVQSAMSLNRIHAACLKMFILSAFDMARELQITPMRLAFAREKELELYNSLMEIATGRQEEIRNAICSTIQDRYEDLLEMAANYPLESEIKCCLQFLLELFMISCWSADLPQDGSPLSASGIQDCWEELQDLVIGTLNSEVALKIVGSVNFMRDSFVGTLQRCLESLEKTMRDQGEGFRTTQALKQILNAAYSLDANVVGYGSSGVSLFKIVWERVKRAVTMTLAPWRHHQVKEIDVEWKKRAAADVLASISESKLTKCICSQFRERLRASHESFLNDLVKLENYHCDRLERTEERSLKVRRQFAPKVARLYLESTSLKDYVLFGMPSLGREIGRGQYGVVFSCDSWAGFSPCAVKSVVPPDEKHWNDLALEFYYTRCVPEHERIVALRGSVIDHSYGPGGGSSPAVLLIMERLSRDLYVALKAGLSWKGRLRVALDVVQAIRFLHSQGLVHRDVKLKNVLLDTNDRGKLTDLGFCKPEAMMSGSIVGTPIHMAPELFSGHYDSSVDVYAFGVLFWYICAGHTRLPYVFEQCQNKDQLWSCVKRGARPERLPYFDEECWALMSECWAGSPHDRPLLGEVEPRLAAILERFQTAPAPDESSPRKNGYNFPPRINPHVQEKPCSSSVPRAKPSLTSRMSMIYNLPDHRLEAAHWLPEL